MIVAITLSLLSSLYSSTSDDGEGEWMVVRIGRMHRYAVNASYFIVATRNRCLRPLQVEKAVIVTHFTHFGWVERFWGQNFTQLNEGYFNFRSIASKQLWRNVFVVFTFIHGWNCTYLCSGTRWHVVSLFIAHIVNCADYSYYSSGQLAAKISVWTYFNISNSVWVLREKCVCARDDGETGTRRKYIYRA